MMRCCECGAPATYEFRWKTSFDIKGLCDEHHEVLVGGADPRSYIDYGRFA